ncbi:MAG TPA: hypothetical protein VJA40_01915, partial [archaeon]|nr:hypothetical protein [archaeon]
MIKKFQAAGLALLAVALVAGCASPRGPELSKALESISETQDDLGEKAREGVGVDKKPVAAKAFSCEPLDEGVKTRGYVLLMGVPDHYLEQWDNEKELMLRDPKAVFAVVWDQDETRHIEDLSEWFLGELHALLAQKPVDELVIFGPSAGGVTSSYSIAKLDFTGKVALHTMASPTKGFDLTGFRSQFLGDRTGFIKDIAVGFQPFTKPGDNVKVYHHKTTYDADLMSNCGSLQAFCDTLDVQGNDLPGSNVFYYPEHTHATIMPAVVRTVLKCYNPALPEEEVAFDESAGLGELCYTEDECKAHCQNNRGRCIQYCDAHPENALCGKLRAYWDEVSRGEVGEPSQGPAPEPKKETLPVLQGLGFNIDAWNKNTNLAGDFIFSKKLLFDDGRVKNE